METPDYITPAQAAVIAKRNPETVTLALRNGELKGFQRKAKGRWLTTAAAVSAWITGEPVAA